MASQLAQGNHDQRCECGMFVSKDSTDDGRHRYICLRCGPQLDYSRNRQN